MNKLKLVEQEMNYIKDHSVKESLKIVIQELPDYFFTVPAASTGKYHPEYASGEGGLLRHSKAAMKIGEELLSNPAIGSKYTQKEKDIMLMGLLIHDGLKLGKEKSQYTKFDHPILMANYIEELKDKLLLTEEDRTLLKDVIKTHMGYWTTDYNGNEILEKPKTKYQNFVHMCDFLASRKFLLVPFDDQNNIIL